MVTDTAAAERMVERLLLVRWDGDVAFTRTRSRARLGAEFLRRTAVWAQTLGAERGWPFSDLAGALDPDVSVDPALLAKLELDVESSDPFPVRPDIGKAMVRWAALGDLPRQRFPDLDDPYEPMLALFERGGGFSLGPGSIELGFVEIMKRSITVRVQLEQKPIDEATLDALDQEKDQ